MARSLAAAAVGLEFVNDSLGNQGAKGDSPLRR